MRGVRVRKECCARGVEGVERECMLIEGVL